MTAIAAPTPQRVVRPHRGPLRAAAAALLGIVATVILAMAVAVAIMAAAEARGIDVNVPEPGPIPQPSVAPPGMGL